MYYSSTIRVMNTCMQEWPAGLTGHPHLLMEVQLHSLPGWEWPQTSRLLSATYRSQRNGATMNNGKSAKVNSLPDWELPQQADGLGIWYIYCKFLHVYANGVYTSIIGTQGSASCKSEPDEMYKQHSILHDGANTQTRLELLKKYLQVSQKEWRK